MNWFIFFSHVGAVCCLWKKLRAADFFAKKIPVRERILFLDFAEGTVDEIAL